MKKPPQSKAASRGAKIVLRFSLSSSACGGGGRVLVLDDAAQGFCAPLNESFYSRIIDPGIDHHVIAWTGAGVPVRTLFLQNRGDAGGGNRQKNAHVNNEGKKIPIHSELLFW